MPYTFLYDVHDFLFLQLAKTPSVDVIKFAILLAAKLPAGKKSSTSSQRIQKMSTFLGRAAPAAIFAATFACVSFTR